MRSLIIVLAIITWVSAWNLTLNPHGERLINRRSGDNFLVICKVKDYTGAASEVTVNWFRNGNVVARLGSVMTINTPYANQLLINRPKPSDGGVYTCKASVEGETQELQATISFVDPPKFIDPLTDQHPEEGSTAEIKCKVEGAEGLEVFWQFNGTTLDESSPRGYDFEDDKQTLVIKNYNSKKDDGIYHCNAAQHSSFETLSINVTGYSKPVITVFDVPENGRGFEGQSAQLKCGAVGKPQPTYKWLNQEGEEIDNSDKHTVEDGLLVIESLSSEDAGSYKCVATNDIGQDTKTGDINVFLKPRIERMVDVTKKTNEDVELVCRYSGEGDLKAKFVFDDQEYAVIEEGEATSAEKEENSEEKEVLNDSTEDEPTTTASVDEDEDEENEDMVASEEETTTPHPMTREASQEEDDDEGTTTALASDVKAESDEAPADAAPGIDDEEEEENTRWKRYVSDVTSDRVSVRSDGNSLILTVRQLSLEDAGAYRCLVENEAGTSNRTMNLAITHAPVLRSSSEDTVRSYNGNSVTVYCEVSAVPQAKWTWFKDDDEIEADGTSVVIDSSDATSRLTIEDTQGRYGTYKCKAENGIGEMSHEMRVIQIVAPGEPIGLDCKQFVYPNYGKCFVSEGTYDDEASEPTEIEFQVAKMDDVDADYEWNNARVFRVDYDAKGMAIPDLEPSTQYQVRAKALNEAGDSGFIEPVNMETTEPWAPLAPEEVEMECQETCTVSWSEPNDHGAEITGYNVQVDELEKGEETQELVPTGTKFSVSVDPDEKSVEIRGIKPHSFYRISVHASNSVGPGAPTTIDKETDEYPTSTYDPTFDVKRIAIIAGIALLVLFLVVDLICCKVNNCGLFACICYNCCGRESRKEKDLEAGRGETGRLLDHQTR